MLEAFKSIGLIPKHFDLVSVCESKYATPDSRSNHLVIVCSEKVGYVYDNGIFSLLDFIETYADLCKDYYFSFFRSVNSRHHSEKALTDYLFIRNDLSLWSIGLVPEHHNVLSGTGFTDVLKFLVLRNLLDELNYTNISIDDSSSCLFVTLRDYLSLVNSSDQPIIIKACFRFVVFIAKVLFYYCKSMLYFGYFLLNNFSFIFFASPIASEYTHDISFFNYLFNQDKYLCTKGHFQSSYWGPLIDLMDSMKVNSNWFHLFIKHKSIPNCFSAFNIIKLFNRNSRFYHSSIFSFLDWRLVLRALILFLKIQFSSLYVLFILFYFKRRTFLPLQLLFNEITDSLIGPHAIRSILYLHAFERIFIDLPYQKLGFFLQENFFWEKILAYAWRKYQHGTLVGVPHSTIRFWDLRYFANLADNVSSPPLSSLKPDLYASNSNSMTDHLLSAAIPPDQIIELEALRFTYLLNLNPPHTFSISSFTILLIGDHLPELFLQQISFLNEVTLCLSIPINVIVKPHPFCKFSRISLPPDWICLTDPLKELLPKASFVFVGGITSAILDAYSYGLPVCYQVNKYSLDYSPLKSNEDVYKVTNTQDLLSLLVTHLNNPRIISPSLPLFYSSSSLRLWQSILHGSF